MGSTHSNPEPGLARLAGELIEGATTVTDVRRLSAGASQEMWSFTVLRCDARHPMILRRAPKNVARSELHPDLETEAALMQVAAQHGVPTPPVCLVLRPEHELGRGFVMKHIEGETIPRRLLRDPAFARVRPLLPGMVGEVFAKIHAVPVAELPALRQVDARTKLMHLKERYQQCRPRRPIFELAFAWLEQQMPAPAPVRLVHGDLRSGNIMVSPERLEAALDWEVAHLGDPMEDLGWFCINSWRFGEIDKPAGGFGARRDLYEGYRRQSGIEVDERRVRFWEAMGSLSWGISCARMACDTNTDKDRAMEKAMIGRRASECEIDLLMLMEEETDRAIAA